MWKSISPQQEICPSSLTSRACLSHRRRPSTFSLAASTQDAPSNRWSISHRDGFSELCPCGLFSLMRSASSVCPPPPVSPVLRGRAQKRRRLEEASTHTHDANGYQATTSDRSCLQVSSVSRIAWKVSVLKHYVLYETLVVGP